MPKWGKVVAHLLMILFSLACLVPFLLVVAASFTDETTLIANGFGLIPEKFSLDAYKYIFRVPDEVFAAYGTTIFITIFGMRVRRRWLRHPPTRRAPAHRRIPQF